MVEKQGWQVLQAEWREAVKGSATKEQRRLAAELERKGHSELDIFVLVYAWESNVLKNFWDVVPATDAYKLSLREAIIYALQVACGFRCDGSENVRVSSEIVDKLRAFVAAGIKVGRVDAPKKQNKKPVTDPTEQSHRILSEIREAVRRDARLNMGKPVRKSEWVRRRKKRIDEIVERMKVARFSQARINEVVELLAQVKSMKELKAKEKELVLGSVKRLFGKISGGA